MGFQALRRLPQTLNAIEAAARKVAIEAPRKERHWYEMPAVWIAFLGGAILALALTAGGGDRAPRQPPPTSAIETPAQPDANPLPRVDTQADLASPETEAPAPEATP
jgi:hypothetical protein